MILESLVIIQLTFSIPSYTRHWVGIMTLLAVYADERVIVIDAPTPTQHQNNPTALDVSTDEIPTSRRHLHKLKGFVSKSRYT